MLLSTLLRTVKNLTFLLGFFYPLLILNKSVERRFFSAQFQHSTVLQLWLHSYGYAPYIASCIALNLNTITIKELIDWYLVALTTVDVTSPQLLE